MTPDRYKELCRVFDDVCAAPPEQRKGLLELLRRDDPELLVEIESMLAHEHSSPDMEWKTTIPERLEAELIDALDGTEETSAPDRIGTYDIVRRIASGSMGVVYEATQDNPRRTVALKVLQKGLLSKQALRRFEHESLILSRLNHPGIARIYSAGVHEREASTLPYFAMELIEGMPLAEYVQAHQPQTRSLLDLFIRICDAVQYAHVKGIIHRDLKPGNILVVDLPEGPLPKILDFGVARVTDSDMLTTTHHTEYGKLIGTVAYMSPEQAVGDPNAIDTRSDVYSLGVILFELMAQQLPLAIDGLYFHEALRVIREDEPTRLGTIDRSMRGDLETIIAKALEKNISQRYQSAVELTADLKRYLAREPILARPPSIVYRLRKFSSRNKSLVSGLAASLVLMITAIIGTSYGMLDAIEQRRLAEEEAQKYASIVGVLRGMMIDSEPLMRQDNSLEDTTVDHLLELLGPSFETSLKDQPEALAEVHQIVGQWHGSLMNHATAEKHFKTASTMLRQLDSDPSELARCLQQLGASLVAQRRYSDAVAPLEESLSIQREQASTDTFEYATTLNFYSRTKVATWDIDEALGSLSRSISILEKLPQREATRELIRTLLVTGMAHVKVGNHNEARQAFERALKINDHLYQDAKKLDYWHFVSHTKAYLGGIHWAQGENELALRLFQEVQSTLDIYGINPHQLASNINSIGICLRDLGRYDEAEKRLLDALRLREALYSQDHPWI